MNQDIKSKADALKYAIEFTAEDGKPNSKAAQELFDFICKNLSVSEDTVNEARLHTQKRIDEIGMHANACIGSLLEYSSEPRCSVIAEGAKEKERANSSYYKEINYIHELLRNRGYEYVSRVSSNGFRDRLFRLENDNESLEVVINRIPKVIALQRDKNKIISNDTEAEIATVRSYLLARGYKISAGGNEPETYVLPKLNIKIAFV